MAIIGEKITLDKTLVGNIARNQMESKMELTTKGALYVGTGDTNSVIPDGGGIAVPIPITSHIAPNGASDDGKVLVADSKETVGWKISACPLDKTSILNLVYPVGSIYMSVNNVSPQTFLGGTWTAWGSGRVPVGVSTNDSDFGTVEKTGGEKKHQLTTNEMPSHRHIGQYSYTKTYTNHAQKPTDPPTQALEVNQGTQEVEVQYKVITDNVATTLYYASGSGPTNDIFFSEKVKSQYGVADNGSDIAHNNLQPYITCYMWKRTA